MIRHTVEIGVLPLQQPNRSNLKLPKTQELLRECATSLFSCDLNSFYLLPALSSTAASFTTSSSNIL